MHHSIHSRTLDDVHVVRLMFQVVYSKNHNLLRSVGFIAVLAAATRLYIYVFYMQCFALYSQLTSVTQVRNTRKGGLLFFAPPCSTWVFLTLICKLNSFIICGISLRSHSADLRSSSTTGRSWINPEGRSSKSVHLANVFVMRMLYMCLGCLFVVRWFIDKIFNHIEQIIRTLALASC